MTAKSIHLQASMKNWDEFISLLMKPLRSKVFQVNVSTV